jgi:hypothetical protein
MEKVNVALVDYKDRSIMYEILLESQQIKAW